MPKERTNKKIGSKNLPLEEYLKQLPSPPKEHAHELKMEKRVKKLLKEQKNKDKISASPQN